MLLYAITNSRRNSPPRHRRRGTVIVAMVVVLVVLSLMVIGLTRGGQMDQKLTTSRVFADKAQYVAEGVANMALREMYNAADEDGDGGTGSISTKTINGCTGAATKSVSGSTTTITVTGSGNNQNVKLQMTLN